MFKGLAPIVRGRCTECGYSRNLFVNELSDTVPCNCRERGCSGILEVAYTGPKKLMPPELSNPCSCHEREAREAAQVRHNEAAAVAADKMSLEKALVDGDVRGHVSVGTNDGSPKVCVVSFGFTFAEPPHVFATARSGEPGQSFCVSVRAVTASQCAFNVCRSDAGAGNEWTSCVELDWHAVATGSRAPSRRSACDRALVGRHSAQLKECVRIPFGKEFDMPPHVFATAVAERHTGLDFDDCFAVTVRSVSTTAFTVNVLRVDTRKGWGQDLQLDWHADTGKSDSELSPSLSQFGRTDVGARSASSPTSMKVTFATAFAEPPHVIVATRGQDFRDVFCSSVLSISPSGFLVDVMRIDDTKSTWGQHLQLDWVALPPRPASALEVVVDGGHGSGGDGGGGVVAATAVCEPTDGSLQAPPPAAIAKLVCAKLLTGATIVPADETAAVHLSVAQQMLLTYAQLLSDAGVAMGDADTMPVVVRYVDWVRIQYLQNDKLPEDEQLTGELAALETAVDALCAEQDFRAFVETLGQNGVEIDGSCLLSSAEPVTVMAEAIPCEGHAVSEPRIEPTALDLLPLAAVLNKSNRSMLVKIDNQTPFALRLKSCEAEYGDWE